MTDFYLHLDSTETSTYPTRPLTPEIYSSRDSSGPTATSAELDTTTATDITHLLDAMATETSTITTATDTTHLLDAMATEKSAITKTKTAAGEIAIVNLFSFMYRKNRKRRQINNNSSRNSRNNHRRINNSSRNSRNNHRGNNNSSRN